MKGRLIEAWDLTYEELRSVIVAGQKLWNPRTQRIGSMMVMMGESLLVRYARKELER